MIHVLALGDDSTLKYITLENGVPTSGGWQSNGRWFSQMPAVFSRRRSQLEVIATTPYGRVLCQESRTGLLLKDLWEPLGSTIISPLSGVSSTPNDLDIYGLGTDRKVYCKELILGDWFPSREGWWDLGGSFSLPPLAVGTPAGHIHLFCLKDYNECLAHKWWNGSAWLPNQSEFAPNATRCMSPPAATAVDRDRLIIFIRTDEGLKYGMFREGEWFQYIKWIDAGKPGEEVWVSRPAVVLTRSGHVVAFCLASDNSLYRRRFQPLKNSWESEEWISLGGDFASAPMAIVDRSGDTYVFCKGFDEEIYYASLKKEVWTSLGHTD